jgi:hypothetical protein
LVPRFITMRKSIKRCRFLGSAREFRSIHLERASVLMYECFSLLLHHPGGSHTILRLEN